MPIWRKQINISRKKRSLSNQNLLASTSSQDPLVITSAAKMSLGTLMSRVLGFLRDVLLASLFPRSVTDSFVIAFRLPNLFRRVFGEGAIASGFIPLFLSCFQKKETVKEGRHQALSLAGGVWAFLTLFTALITALGVFWMEEILSWILTGPSFLNVPDKFKTTVFLARLTFTYFFFVTQFAFFMSMLNALGHFFTPALAPALFNFVMILFILIPSDWAQMFPFSYFQVPGIFLGFGVFVGGVLQMALVVWAIFRQGFLPRWKWNGWKETGVFQVVEKIFPSLVSLLFLQMISMANIYFASYLKEGTHSYLYWGDRILELPHSLIAISLGTALLPKLSKLWNPQSPKPFIHTLEESIKLLLFLALPSAVGLYFLASPIIEVLFMRGEFQMEDLEKTTQVIHFYSFFLIASSLSKVFMSVFYACKKPWWLVYTSGLTLILHVLLSYLFVPVYGLYGLVGATTLSGFLQLFFLSLGYPFWLGLSLNWKALLKDIFKMLFPLFFMGLGLWAFTSFLFQRSEDGSGLSFFELLLVIGFFALFYFCLSFFFKISQMNKILNALKEKFTKSNQKKK